VAMARLMLLVMVVRLGTVAAMVAVRCDPRFSAYYALLDGLRPAVVSCLAGAISVHLGIHTVSDERYQYCLERFVWLSTTTGLITGAKWLLEAFYSTRLLKLKCGEAVRRNSWERAVLERLQEVGTDKMPSAPTGLSQSTNPGPWQFELECAWLIRHAHDAKGPVDVDFLEDATRTEAKQIVTKLRELRDAPTTQAIAEGQQCDGSATPALRRRDSNISNCDGSATPARRRRDSKVASEGQRDGSDTPAKRRRDSKASEKGRDDDESATVELADFQQVLLPHDAERAWAWFWGEGDEGTGAWLWDEGESMKAPSVHQDVIAQRVLHTRAETTELVSSICQYNTIFALFRFVVQCLYWTIVSLLALAIFFPSGFERLCWAFSSLVVALSFIFGSLLREVCESLLLILIIRPFDVGDRVVVHGARLLVVELHVLTTTFLNECNEVVYLRNSLVFQDRDGFVNLSHSENGECMIQLEIVAEDSTPQNVTHLELATRRHCAARPDVWLADVCGTPSINTAGCVGMTVSMTSGLGGGYVCWTFRAVHKRNLQDPYQARVDSSRLLAQLVNECVTKGIRLRRPPVEVVPSSTESSAGPETRMGPRMTSAF